MLEEAVQFLCVIQKRNILIQVGMFIQDYNCRNAG